MTWREKYPHRDYELRLFVRGEVPCKVVIDLYSDNGANIPQGFLDAVEAACLAYMRSGSSE